MIPQSLKPKPQMLSMILFTLLINQNIVNGNNYKLVQEWPKHPFIKSIKAVDALVNPKDITKNL